MVAFTVEGLMNSFVAMVGEPLYVLMWDRYMLITMQMCQVYLNHTYDSNRYVYVLYMIIQLSVGTIFHMTLFLKHPAGLFIEPTFQ